jgi:anti-sigma B factor antagonist
VADGEDADRHGAAGARKTRDAASIQARLGDLQLNDKRQEKEENMVWNITKEGNLTKVEVVGRLVAAVAPSLLAEVSDNIAEGSNVLFDMAKMVHIDSSGLGALVQVLQKVKAGGGKVILAALQPAPKIVFDITKVSRVFEIVPTVADAKFD